MRLIFADELGKPLITYEGKHIYEVNGTYLSILNEIHKGNNTFTGMYKAHKISTKTLADMLYRMVECELLLKKDNPDSGRSNLYELKASRDIVSSTPYTDIILITLIYVGVKIGLFFMMLGLSTGNIVIDAIFLPMILLYSIYVRRRFTIPKE